MNRRQRLLARMVRQVAMLTRRRWFCEQRLMAKLVRRYVYRERIQSPYGRLTGRWGWRMRRAYEARS